jgi:hypothetical protein
MALHVFADSENVRPVRALRRRAPHVGVVCGPAGFGEIVATLPVCGLCPAGAITGDCRR